MKITNQNVSKGLISIVRKAICCFSASCVSLTAIAAMPPMIYPNMGSKDIAKPLNLDEIARMELLFQNENVAFDLSRYVPPKDMRVGMSDSDFADVIVKNSLSRFVESYRQHPNLKSLNRASQGLQIDDVKLGSGGQSLKFRLNPLRKETKLTYRGIASAEVTYNLEDEALRLEISNQIGMATVVASHIDNSGHRSNTLGVRWEF